MTGRRIDALRGLPVADQRLAKIGTLACLSELQGYRDSAPLTGRALSAEERAALTRREAALRRAG